MSHALYVLRADPDRYQSLCCTNEDAWDELLDMFDGRPMKAKWQPSEVELLRESDSDTRLLTGDFPSWGGIIPVFSQKAISALGCFLDKSGEVLPLRCQSGIYFAYNCTTNVDGLDLEHSKVMRMPSGMIFKIHEYAFDRDKIDGLDIFKLLERVGDQMLVRNQLYVSQAFVNQIRKSQLQGFELRAVWHEDSTRSSTGS